MKKKDYVILSVIIGATLFCLFFGYGHNPWTVPVVGLLLPLIIINSFHNIFQRIKKIEKLICKKIGQKPIDANTENKLRQLSKAVEQSPASVVITDTKGFIEYVNPKFVQLTGYSKEEVLGKNPRILKSGSQPPEFYARMWQALSAGKEWRCEFHNLKKNGESYWESATISPIKDDDGNVTHYIAIKEDITERKRLEKVKNDFVSMVSHELRTPLAAIKEAVAIVHDETTGPINSEQKEFLELAKRNIERLARLINNILDFQRLEQGKQKFDFKENNINETASEVCQTMQSLAKGKGLDLTLQITKNIPLLTFDRDKIIQVLANLINNAIKFTEEGHIVVETSHHDNIVQVSVKDSGPGISKEDMDRLFQQFVQLETPSERKVGSSGLGLAISKEIILAHNGKIWAESEVGKGSIFRFILPVHERRK